MRNIKFLSLSLLLAVFLLSSCDEQESKNLTSSTLNLSATTGNNSLDTLVAATLASFITQGVVIDSIIYIGVDIQGQVKTVIKGSNGDTYFEVAEPLQAEEDDEEKTFKSKACSCNGQEWWCNVTTSTKVYTCGDHKCCSWDYNYVDQLEHEAGMAQLSAMAYLPTVVYL
jgi:hypothetical protein